MGDEWEEGNWQYDSGQLMNKAEKLSRTSDTWEVGGSQSQETGYEGLLK